PPVAELGRLVGLDPLPMSVREARRELPGLREAMRAVPNPSSRPPRGEVAVKAAGLTVAYGEHVALEKVPVQAHAGEILAVMGRNGAGKSSLLWALAGAFTPQAGRVEAGGQRVALVPQSPGDLLFRLTVEAECAAADAGAGRACARELLDGISPGI